MNKFAVIFCLALLFALEVFSFSLNGRFVGEKLHNTTNAYVCSKYMYFVDSLDTIVARRMLVPMGDDFAKGRTSLFGYDDILSYYDYGIYCKDFLTEDSVYTLVLQPVTKTMLSETTENEAFYYKSNCIFPDSADNLFYEIRSDTVASSFCPPSFNMYVDIDNRLYKIKKLTPSTGDHNMGRFTYFEIPRSYIPLIINDLDSLYGYSAQPQSNTQTSREF